MNVPKLASFISILALTSALTGTAFAQPAPTPRAYPSWTGATYPFEQHLSIMLLHLDDAALAMARTAQRDAKSAGTKLLSSKVIAERTRDIAALHSLYTQRYGQEPPAWPAPQNGSGPRMMGGYDGMMGGYGGMMGGNPGRRMGGAGYGPMMGYGDTYQMMMGNRANWWGSSSIDASFAPALMRLDAMEISMATLGLTSTESAMKALTHKVVSARAAELSQLAAALE